MLTEKIIGTIGYMGGIMSVPEPFAFSWGNMLVYSHETLCQPGEHIHPERAKQSLHDWARNELVTKMKGDWLLMLDTDVQFQPDFAARLVMQMERHNLDVVTGIYSFKKDPHFPVLYMYNHGSDRYEVISEWDRTSDLLNIDSAGGGCLLVRRRVFDRIRNELHEAPFNRYGSKGEDHSFFTRLRKLGIQAWCACNVELEHLTYRGITPSADYTTVIGAHEYDTEAVTRRAPGQPEAERNQAWQ